MARTKNREIPKREVEPEIEEVIEETGREAFERVSGRRVNNVAESIRVLKKMSRNPVYEYDNKDVDKMFDYLKEELRKAEAAFRKDTKSGFTW